MYRCSAGIIATIATMAFASGAAAQAMGQDARIAKALIVAGTKTRINSGEVALCA